MSTHRGQRLVISYRKHLQTPSWFIIPISIVLYTSPDPNSDHITHHFRLGWPNGELCIIWNRWRDHLTTNKQVEIQFHLKTWPGQLANALFSDLRTKIEIGCQCSQTNKDPVVHTWMCWHRWSSNWCQMNDDMSHDKIAPKKMLNTMTLENVCRGKVY